MTDFRPQRPRLFVFVRHMLIVLVALVVAGAGIAGLVAIQEHVTAFGDVRPRDEVPLHSLVDAVVLDVRVEDGDIVQTGQCVMVLDDLAVRTQLAAAEDSLALKQADLVVSQRSLDRLRVAPLPDAYRFTELELARARSRLASAQESLSRQQSLYDKGLASDQDLTDAKATVAMAANDLSMAERREQLVKGGMGETILGEAEAGIARIQAEVGVLENQITRTKELLSRFRVDASVGGRVVRVTKKQGEPVTRGELVAVLAAGEERRVFLTVPAQDVVKVQRGQQVHLYSALFPYLQYGVAYGEVYMVANWAQTGTTSSAAPASSYEVRVYITKAPYTLPLGSPVQGDILVGKKQIYRILLGLD
jgi:multidrug resistance efflux pump